MERMNRSQSHSIDFGHGVVSRRALIKWATALGLSAPALTRAQMLVAAQANGEDTGLLVAPEVSPKRGGTLRTAFGVTTTSYDIHQGGNLYVLTQLYDGLIRFNPLDGLQTIIPSLATGWETSEDGLSYTFPLRSGVAFHDGGELTADDVVATFMRIIDPPEGMVSVMRSLFRSVESVEALDSLTVRFNFSVPQADFLTVMAAPFSVVYPKRVLDENNQDLRAVVAPGTGPFIFEEYQEGERWILSRNPNYWNPELPYVDRMEMLNVPAWSDRGTAILTDQADLSWNVSVETFEAAESRDDVAGKKVPSTGAYTVIINTTREELSDPKVRRAMYLALNRRALREVFRTQETIAVSRWVSPASPFAMPAEEILQIPGYRDDKEADIEEAKSLLAEAGFADGISGLELLSASVAPHAEIMAPAVQDMLKSTLNIDTTIRVVERSLLVEEESKGNFDLVLDTPTIAVSDISSIGNLYFKTGGSQNFGKFSSPEFDALLEAADQELDPEKRTAIIRDVEDALDQAVPWLLIGWTFHLPMWRTALKGLGMDLRTQSIWGRLDLAWLDK